MRDYELTVLLNPALSDKDADKEVKAIVALVEKAGGEIVKKTDPEKRQLAYEIAKAKEALYVFFAIKLDPSKVSELENKAKLLDNVIRYLLVKKGE